MPTKVRLVKAMVVPVVVYGCESWIVKKPEHRKIDAFELWCWRRLLRVPWTASRSNQSILKISPGCSLEGLMLKLKLQYLGHLMRRVDSLEKTLVLGGLGTGGEGDDRGWDGWMTSPTQWTWVWVNSGSWWWTGRPGMLRFMGLQRVGDNWATELNWTDAEVGPQKRSNLSLDLGITGVQGTGWAKREVKHYSRKRENTMRENLTDIELSRYMMLLGRLEQMGSDAIIKYIMKENIRKKERKENIRIKH